MERGGRLPLSTAAPERRRTNPRGFAATIRRTRRDTGGSRSRSTYTRADVWPLAPSGEILVVIMCEDVTGIENLPRILREVPGIGVVLSGEGDLSQNLGYPRQPDHPAVIEGMAAILRICKEHKVPCGRPRVDGKNAQQAVDAGYRFLLAGPVRSFAALDACRKATGRA